MHWRRVGHMLCEPERLENTHTARKEGFSIIAEDDNVDRDLIKRKEAAQNIGILASVSAGFVLLGTNINDASCIDAKTSESGNEMFSLLIPCLTTNTIKPELTVERKEYGRCTVYTVGSDNGDDAVCELADRDAVFGLGVAGRSIAQTTIGTVACEGKVNACHESF